MNNVPVRISDMHRVAKARRPGYLEAIMAKAAPDPQRPGCILIDHQDYKDIGERYAVISKEEMKKLQQEVMVKAGPPGIGQMTVNAAKAGGRFVAGAIQGKELFRTTEEKEVCIKKCQTHGPSGAKCQFYNEEAVRCMHPKCGCFLAVKTRLLTEHCPLPAPAW